MAACWADKFSAATETEVWKNGLAASLQLGNVHALDDAGRAFAAKQETFRMVLTAIGLAK